MLTLIEDDRAPYHKRRVQAYAILLFVLFFAITFFDLLTDVKHDGPTIAFGITAPRLTVLTICRALLAMLSILLAVWPREKPVARPQTEA